MMVAMLVGVWQGYIVADIIVADIMADQENKSRGNN
jgi:hypothetical protein